MREKLCPPLLLDGAAGTRLFAAGMPRGACPEIWILEHPQVILEIQRGYVRAGSDVLYAPTFGGNAMRLGRNGLGDRMREINHRLVELCREASAGGTWVAGDISTAGELCEPFGEARLTDLVDCYAEQALALRDAGADLIVCETFDSLTDLRAAVLGARQTGLPVWASLSVDERGRTFMGSDALAALLTLQSMGVAAFGLNCGEGPAAMLPVIEKLAPYAEIPLIAKPNAGLPQGDPPVYPMTPDELAHGVKKLLEAGASIVGGCCGTTDAHIAALRELLDGFDFGGRTAPPPQTELLLCSDREVFYCDEDLTFSEEIACALDMSDEILDAEDAPCDALLIRVRSFDDAYHFGQNQHMAHLPAAFLADGEEELENALFCYCGRAIIDSRSDVPRERMQELARGYGAVII